MSIQFEKWGQELTNTKEIIAEDEEWVELYEDLQTHMRNSIRKRLKYLTFMWACWIVLVYVITPLHWNLLIALSILVYYTVTCVSTSEREDAILTFISEGWGSSTTDVVGEGGDIRDLMWREGGKGSVEALRFFKLHSGIGILCNGFREEIREHGEKALKPIISRLNLIAEYNRGKARIPPPRFTSDSRYLWTNPPF